MQYVFLVLGEIVQLSQFIHGFAVDGDVQNIVGLLLRPVARPCVTVLVVVGDGGFAALRVGGYDFIDGRAEVCIGFGNNFGNADSRQRHSRNAPAILPAIHILILYRYAETYSHGHSAHAEGIPKA